MCDRVGKGLATLSVKDQIANIFVAHTVCYNYSRLPAIVVPKQSRAVSNRKKKVPEMKENLNKVNSLYMWILYLQTQTTMDQKYWGEIF